MIFIAFIPLIVWLYLLFCRGMFWRMRERDDDDLLGTITAPSVVAVVPARNEADVIAAAITSLLAQDYVGPFRVVLVDDQSSDGTAAAARQAVLASAERLEVISGSERPAGWTGKLWAMKQGLAHSQNKTPSDYVLFTDADIAHASDNVTRLVARAECNRLVLVSLMAKLQCRAVAEKLLIPAFVFFFAMVFPFSWASNPSRKTAAAAGGCMLVRWEALKTAGGLESIKGAIIDDCALASILKRQGPIWLGLSNCVQSLRPYGSMGEIGRMVARSAYAQLHYSTVLLSGTILGLMIVYVVPVLLAIFSHGLSRAAGAVAWLVMAFSFQPILRFYRLSPFWGLALPLMGALYAGFTVQSAVQYWRGRGGMWKGRAQAMA
jgi:hopene-associated glycosyltransferase HpnB